MVYFSTTACTRPGVHKTELILIDTELKRRLLNMKKILNIPNYQKNANQDYNEVPPHTDQNGHDLQVYK